ncbi:MAG: phosphopantetheine-binding protein [Treponema sp.]|jgi:acyl carrier protein|nr:phosphopantetheine-binding protein [Treponema sp.]
MTKDEFALKIRDILTQEFEIDAEVITPEARLYEDLEMDSIDAVDLLVKMKEFMPGKIDAELFKKARTVHDLTEILYSKMGADIGSDEKEKSGNKAQL